MFIKKISFLFSLFLLKSVYADFNELERIEYVVEKGDTLWGISKKILKDPFLWKKIHLNNNHIKNPHLIYPNDIILFNKNHLDNTYSIEIYDGIKEDILLPDMTYKKEKSIDLINLNKINNFYSNNFIIKKEEYNNFYKATIKDSLIAKKNDYIYIDSLNRNSNLFISFENIVPLYKNNQVKGYLLISSGLLEYVSEKDGVIKLKVLESSKGITRSHKIYSLPKKEIKSLFPSKYIEKKEGKILILDDYNKYSGKYGNLIVDLGSKEGIKEADLLKIYNNDNKFVGEVIIYKVEEDFSYGFILNSIDIIKTNYILK